jgi:hypothetical protein
MILSITKPVQQIHKIPNPAIQDLISMAELSVHPETVIKPKGRKLSDLFGETPNYYTFVCITDKNPSSKSFTVPKFKYKELKQCRKTI